jgi:hypothetical protein
VFVCVVGMLVGAKGVSGRHGHIHHTGTHTWNCSLHVSMAIALSCLRSTSSLFLRSVVRRSDRASDLASNFSRGLDDILRDKPSLFPLHSLRAQRDGGPVSRFVNT